VSELLGDLVGDQDSSLLLRLVGCRSQQLASGLGRRAILAMRV